MMDCGEYPPDWPEIARQVKEAAGWRCEHCGHSNVPGHVLTVHHIDRDKSNCEPGNLVALCQVCHLHWQARFLPGQAVMGFARPGWMIERGLGL